MLNLLPIAAPPATRNTLLALAALPHFSGSGVLLFLVVLAGAGGALYALHRNNRLLFWCLAGALGGHLLFAGVLYAMGIIFKPAPREVRITIAAVKLPPKKTIPPPKHLDIPLGSLKGNPKVKVMPHGHHLDKQHSKSKPNPGRVMTSGVGDDGTIPLNDKDQGLFTGDLNDLDTKDISELPTASGEDAGAPEGTGDGDVPAGFPDGKVNGRVYFLRMKQDSGSWNENDDGVKRLLNFLDQFFRCERESRAMSCAEMRERFLNKGAPPSFLYIYADDSFSLSSTDVVILHDYMTSEKGGFLFIDSRPDPEIRDVVSRELDKVLPGMPLRPIPHNHTINTFLFHISDPVMGENTDPHAQNYGVTRNGRLAVFYTMGNFSHLYAAHTSNELPYFAAQYQMGANVMLYAIRKGDNSGIAQHAGANAKITTEALEHLGMLEPTGGGASGKPPASVKVKPTPLPSNPGDEQPDDVKIID